MTTNTLRLLIIERILKADASTLHQVHTLLQESSRKETLDQIEDPDWITIAQAAEQLGRNHAHIRRLALARFPLLVEQRPTGCGQLAYHFRRASLPDLARATMRQSRAKGDSKKARAAKSACLESHAPQKDEIA